MSGCFKQAESSTRETRIGSRVTIARRQSMPNRYRRVKTGVATAAAISQRWCARNASIWLESSETTFLMAPWVVPVKNPEETRESFSINCSRRS